MIRVKYSTARRPAAPIIDVLIGHPDAPPPTHAHTAQLDTGADRTVIPFEVASALNLRHVGELAFGVVGNVITLPVLITLPVYYVTLRIEGVMDFTIDTAADPDEPRVLLGRDVLNALYVHLSGPTRMLELSVQPISTPIIP